MPAATAQAAGAGNATPARRGERTRGHPRDLLEQYPLALNRAAIRKRMKLPAKANPDHDPPQRIMV
jgi:hypothetical protein